MRGLLLLLLIAWSALGANPKDWVPARWGSTDPKTLALLKDTPINCLLLEWKPDAAQNITKFATAAAEQGIATLAVIRQPADAAAAAKADVKGIALEGDFDAPIQVSIPIVEISSREHMKLGGDAPVIGTYQGVWPGVRTGEQANAGPSAAAWIDTNKGFLDFVRAWGNRSVWIANLPPKDTVVTTERYMQVVADAAITGARWVIALDDDFARKLYSGDDQTIRKWKRITGIVQYYEDHKDWRDLQNGAQLAIVQDAKEGGLLSGGILDMIGAKHTPVQAVPPQKLDAAALKDRKLAVSIDSSILSQEGKDTLKQFTRSGGTLLTGPPRWQAAVPEDKKRITLNEQEVKQVDEMWKEMATMIGRRNLGVRLFNVSTMRSNLRTTPDHKQVFVGLVNYADYPVENVTIHVLGKFQTATLILPGGKEKMLEAYPVEEGTGVDLDNVGIVATVKLQ
jgi:hypothetical protein